MIHLCDAVNGLAALPDRSVDMIFTDPPYRTISGGAGVAGDGSPSGVLAKNDGLIFKYNDIDISEYANGLYRVLKSPGHCYVMCNLLNLWRFHSVLTGVGFQVHNLLVWKKNTTNPNRWYMKNCEYVLFLRKGPARQIYTPSEQTVISVDTVAPRNKTHPTEKPVDLIRRYILASSLPGEMVLDPFAGTGSTGVACHETGRKFIGFEIDPAYWVAGNDRLRS